MLAALVIVFREVLEAGLVVGVVLAATRGVRHRSGWIALGVAGGIAGACLAALFAGRIADAFEGSGQEALNAVVLLVAWRCCAGTMPGWRVMGGISPAS